METLRALKTHPKFVMVFWAHDLTNVSHIFLYQIRHLKKKNLSWDHQNVTNYGFFYYLMV